MMRLIGRRVIEKAHAMAMEGTPKQAKYATRVIAHSKNADAACSDLVDVSARARRLMRESLTDGLLGHCVKPSRDQQESRLAPLSIERMCSLVPGRVRKQRREDHRVHPQEDHQC